MKHDLKITISKKAKLGGVVSCRQTTVREKLLRLLLGYPCRLTVLVPGDSVETLSIVEIPEGGAVVE